MPGYDEVVTILESLGWQSGDRPGREQVELALKTASPDGVADRLDAWIEEKAAATPPFYAETEPHIVIVRRKFFGPGSHFAAMYTAIALGQQPAEGPEDTIGEAKTVEDWYGHLALCRNRLGFRAGDQAEYDRRYELAKNVPDEWKLSEEMARLFQLLTWEGYVLPPVSSVLGLTRQQWLDNLRAVDHGMPIPWLPIKPAHKVLA